jgi:exosortase A
VPDAVPDAVLDARPNPVATLQSHLLRWLPHGVLFGLAMLWFMARLLSVPVVEQGALIAAVPTLAWTVNGHAWARRNRFALLFCLLATPVGEFLVPPLMELTATITVALVRLCGIPVLRDGMQLTMASGEFVVAEACSGIRYLIATVTLGLLFAHLTYRSRNRKLWFLLAAVLTPLLANGLRAWLMVMIAHFTDLQYAAGFDHLVYGWLFFGIVIVALFSVGSLFQESAGLAGAVSLPAAVANVSLQQAVPSGALPSDEAAAGTLPPNHSAAPLRASLLALLLLAWAPLAYLAAAQAMSSIQGQLPAYGFPERLDRYTYAGLATFPTPLEYAGADRIDVAAYRGAEQTIYLAAIRYERDRPGHKFVSQSNQPYSWDWNRVGGGVAKANGVAVRYTDVRPKIRLGDELPGTSSVLAGTATGDGIGTETVFRPWRVYSWYVVAGNTTASDVKAKFFAVRDWLLPRAANPPPTIFLVGVPLDSTAGPSSAEFPAAVSAAACLTSAACAP